ncbi:class I SAM-dependent methyltransferase [Phaeovulum vinaykumarii]|uniref:Methyltransferase domain-containing protein n=1 Tax=Phaeovulum vinaykumarii TaxID=407234 RepID=A0A1N7JWG4_9RHOB|nr:class I SAM-dependent methyltransferase [Phaeovulum vinaykumarii]SIS53689.1 Methyltransferase domain-containing protein [Phaeovulum vinaykumarii]SOB91680.1 methyltransferase family protein [Phaeovulum vinaykumarii]
MAYQSDKAWDKLYLAQAEMAYPAEGVIRIFKGRFPELQMPRAHAGLSILDVGCGDGRHLPFFHGLGFSVSAVEITDAICEVLRTRMAGYGVPADIRTGHAGALPFDTASFDRLMTWNSCYYMSLGGMTFDDHVSEMARVLRPGGWIVASIPKKTSFIFRNSVPVEARPGYRVIMDDYFDGGRNGEIMRCMEDRADLEAAFAGEFDTFCHADLDMEWFGLAYHWHVFCARRKG